MICIGGGSHYTDIEALAHRCGIRNITVYDDNPESGWPQPPEDIHGALVIGINSPTERRDIALRFPQLRGCAPIVDPSAIIGPDVYYGHGVVVNPLVSLLHSVTLGDHVHLNTGVQMVRTTIGDYSTISCGATICGDVDIGEATWIGAGAIIADRCTIGNEVVIGAGAIIPPLSFVPNGAKIVGVFKD